MSTSIKYHIGPRKQDGLAKLYIFLIHNRHVSRIAIPGILLVPSDFNGKIKASAKSIKNPAQVNSWLNDLQSGAYKIINELAQEGRLDTTTGPKLNQLITVRLFGDKRDTGPITFDSYTEGLIAELILAKRAGNAAVYKQALQFMQKRAGENLHFGDITFELLHAIEAKYYSEGFHANGLSTRLRTIRAIFARAIKEKIITPDLNPFSDYQIKEEPTVKRAIPLDDIRLINDYSPPECSKLFNVRNYFMFSFHMRGMNFTDIALLRVRDIQDNRVSYRRQKTKKLFSMSIVDPAAEILACYLPGKVQDDFVFPIITRTEVMGQWLQLRNANKLNNIALKDLATELKINKNLTTYVARHTWATLGKRANVPTAIISEGLGHSTEMVTQIYLDSFENKAMDDAGADISKLLANIKKKEDG